MIPATADARGRLYVPNYKSRIESVIDPATLEVTHNLKLGRQYPQQVVLNWDPKALYSANNSGNSDKGDLSAGKPMSAKPGKSAPVDDPYNL